MIRRAARAPPTPERLAQSAEPLSIARRATGQRSSRFDARAVWHAAPYGRAAGGASYNPPAPVEPSVHTVPSVPARRPAPAPRPDGRRHAGRSTTSSARGSRPTWRWSTRSRTTSSAPAASASGRGWCCCSRDALGFDGPERFELAAIVEFIHTATLLHDDVVDESALRRGRADRQCAVRQRRQRAGRRLPVFARLPDDGLGRTACACWRCWPTRPTSSPKAKSCS